MKQLKFITALFFTFLIGLIPIMAQENNAKCVMIETSQGEILEYYISSHPRLTQNNDKVTLTTDDETLEFETVEIKKVYTSIATIKVVYMLDGEVYKTYYHHAGIKLKSEPAPTKEGYSFSGWSEIPETMPAHDVTITGSFILLGDADGDGKVDVNDVTSTINHILNKPVATFIFEAADMDDDEKIDVNDVQAIIYKALVSLSKGSQ